MYDFDPTRTIFVCNKWDQVPVKEEETVWNNTVKKLKDHWPNFSESQMKISSYPKFDLRAERDLVDR
jgi:receptor-interacting serine/threonine-protein kinase 5